MQVGRYIQHDLVIDTVEGIVLVIHLNGISKLTSGFDATLNAVNDEFVKELLECQQNLFSKMMWFACTGMLSRSSKTRTNLAESCLLSVLFQSVAAVAVYHRLLQISPRLGLLIHEVVVVV